MQRKLSREKCIEHCLPIYYRHQISALEILLLYQQMAL